MTAIRKIYKEITELIERANTILITSHLDPDGDSIGSQLALKKYIKTLNKDAVVINQGTIPNKYKFLPGINQIEMIDEFRKPGRFDLALVLDCPGLDRTGKVAELVSPDTKIINIDHHPDNESFGDVVLLDNHAAAVGEILAEFFIYAGFEIDKDTATSLFAAILTDTGRFHFDSTTKRTMEIAGTMIEFGANPRKISDNIYYSFSEQALKLIGMLFSQMILFDDGRICLISLEKEILEGNKFDLSDTEGMAEYTLYGRSVVAGALLREIDSTLTKVSLRSRNGINVSELAHKYGGGGHINASGYTVNLPIDVAGKKLLEDLRGIIHVSI